MDTMIIGDLHVPYEREGYLEFCLAMKKKHKIKRVIFAGDILDNHYSSFHDSDPDLASAGDELSITKAKLQKWFKAFPKAYVCIGNHDRIPNRKAFNAGLSESWIKTIGEVIGAPKGWVFDTEFIFDNVLYIHGEGSDAKSRMMKEWCSVVQGHHHTKAFVWHHVSRYTRAFAMQVGTGIDKKAKAFDYAKYHDRPHVSVGIVKELGKLAFLEHMELGGVA